MLIQAKDLSHQLKRGLSRFYFLFGDEPLQHKEALDTLRAEAKANGFTEREIFEITPAFEWGSLFASLNTQSIFGEKRFIECRLQDSKIGKTITDPLLQLAHLPLSQDTIVLVIAPKIDTKLQQSNWFTALQNKGCTIAARMLSAEENFRWLEKRVLANGLEIDKEGIRLLFERTEGNLLAAAQAIEKLLLYTDRTAITTEDIVSGVSINARFNVFDLVDATLGGAAQRTTQILLSLQGEGSDPIFVIWALAREVRTILQVMHKAKDKALSSTLLQEHGIWKRKEPVIRAFINRFSISDLQSILLELKSVDDIVKGREPGNAWSALFSVCHTLTGAYNPILGAG